LRCNPCRYNMAIEAVIENLDLKQKIFADLEASCRPDCILSTNTSTIDITKVAAKMKNPERIVGKGLHSFPSELNMSSSVQRITQLNS